jgi:hypothetical protein
VLSRNTVRVGELARDKLPNNKFRTINVYLYSLFFFLKAIKKKKEKVYTQKKRLWVYGTIRKVPFVGMTGWAVNSIAKAVEGSIPFLPNIVIIFYYYILLFI